MILTSFTPPTEGIVHQQENTCADLQGKDLGKGILYIAESCVSWMSSSGEGFSLQYPSISLHAVSRDLNAYPHECLYVMVDGKLNENEVNNSSDSEEEEEEISDLRFIPEDKGALDAIFQAMSSCQVLHPDEEYSNSEDEIIDEDDYYTSEDALENLTDQGRATLERLEGMLAGQSDVPVVGRTANGDNADNQMETEDNSMETGQFEDADH